MASMNKIGQELQFFPMNSGTGANSYVQNSSVQRGGLDVASSIIKEEIATKFNIKSELVKNGVFIADFGCSTGHNSFPAMEMITEAIRRIHESAEFHVYFNDTVLNDFNTLFTSLPHQRNYRASGVPGGFHGRLLPKSCLHFAYSSFALQWLSKVPEAVTDTASPAWNKGAIFIGSRKEVRDAYLDQFGKDVAAFLESRAVEMVDGGLMSILLPALPEQVDFNDFCELQTLGTCLMDMAKMGRVSEEKIDSFNIPVYKTTPQQLEAILETSKSFSIERMEILDNPIKNMLFTVDASAAIVRAGSERLLSYHFGGEIIDELFDLYKKKLAVLPNLLDLSSSKSIVILAILKRKAD